MSPSIIIVEAKPFHCGAILRRLRREHSVNMHSVTSKAHRDLRENFDASSFRRAVYIDGDLVAVGGVVGAAASTWGHIWLCMSEATKRYPLAIARLAREQLAEIMETRHELGTVAFGEDDKSLLFALSLGFTASGDSGVISGEQACLRKRALEHIRRDTSMRVPIGASYIIPLRYRGES